MSVLISLYLASFTNFLIVIKHNKQVRICDAIRNRRVCCTPLTVFYSAKTPFILLAILLSLNTAPLQAQSLESIEKNYVVVTVPQNLVAYNKNRKLKSYRPQMLLDSSGMQVRMTQIGKLPKGLKKVQARYKNIKGKSEVITFRKDSMLSRIKMDQLSGDILKYQWHSLTATRPPNTDETVSFRIKQGWFKKYTFTTDTLPVTQLSGFPAIDVNPCEPFDRFYARKQLKGYGLDKFKYEAYKIPNRKIIRQSFEIFFDRNKATLADSELQPIIDYLKKNDLSILNIRIEGYSSIEGDSVLNSRLHQKRAQKLVSLLQKYNNEPVFRDTLILAEAWEPFRNSIRHTPYKWLDTLSNSAIRNRINSDDELLEQIEPYLKPLRRGKISIDLSGKFTNEDIAERLKGDFNRVALELKKANTSGKPDFVREAKLLGMIQYLDAMVQAGNASHEELADLVDESPFPEQTRILLFYHFIKTQEESKTQFISNNLDSLFADREWNNIFWVAHTNIIELIYEARKVEDRARRLRQAVDIQYYTIKYIEAGLLDPEVLCSIKYPIERVFYGMKLNHYAIAYALSKNYDFPCYGFEKDTIKAIVQPAAFNEQKLNDFIEEESQRMEYDHVNRKGTFDISEKGDYYFFIKTLFLSRDKSILEFVRTSDNFAEFDLYYLLRLTLDESNPFTNHYYDSDIQLAEIGRLISQLQFINKRICPLQLSQLYLDYHFKTMIYLQEHFIPGNKEQVRLAERSFHYISNYYQRRSNLLFPKLTVYLVDVLNNFYWLPTRKASTEYASKIIETINKKTILSEQEQLRWEVYKKMYLKKVNGLIKVIEPQLAKTGEYRTL